MADQHTMGRRSFLQCIGALVAGHLLIPHHSQGLVAPSNGTVIIPAQSMLSLYNPDENSQTYTGEVAATLTFLEGTGGLAGLLLGDDAGHTATFGTDEHGYVLQTTGTQPAHFQTRRAPLGIGDYTLNLLIEPTTEDTARLTATANQYGEIQIATLNTPLSSTFRLGILGDGNKSLKEIYLTGPHVSGEYTPVADWVIR